MHRSRITPRRGRRGTVMMMAIVMAVVITGLVAAMAWVAGESAQRTGMLNKVDQAFYAAESGAQRVEWYCKKGQMGSITSPLTGSVNGYSYSTSWSTVSGPTISIASVGTSGTCSYTLSETVTPPATSTVAAMCAGGNNGNISGTVTITGDFQTNKDINSANHLTVTGNLTIGAAMNCSPTVGGSLSVNGDCNGAPAVSGNMIVTGTLNSSPTVHGNLAVNGNIWGTPHVTGTTSAHASNTVTVATPPNVATIVTNLESTAGKLINNPSSITTLDFTQSPNGIIYINGDANINSACTVIGSGTVVVSGNWNQSARFPATGTANVNVVCAHDLNISSGGIYLNGSLYAGNNWNQSSAFSITGVVVTAADENVSGSGSITATAVPSFDTRASSGSGVTTVSKFTGPNP